MAYPCARKTAVQPDAADHRSKAGHTVLAVVGGAVRRVSGGAPALLKTYYFSDEIRTISYDFDDGGKYMIATNAGRLYYVSTIADTTGNTLSP